MSYQAVFMVGGNFTKDGIQFLTDVKKELAHRKRRLKVLKVSKSSEDLKQEKPYIIRLQAESEEELHIMWQRYVTRVNVIGAFGTDDSQYRWLSWSIAREDDWFEKTLLITWRKVIEPWNSTPTKLVMRTEPTVELLRNMSLETLISKAGPGLRIWKPSIISSRLAGNSAKQKSKS